MKKLISVLLCMIMLFSVGAVGSTHVFAAQKQAVASSVAPMAYNPGNTEDQRTGFSKAIHDFTKTVAEIFAAIFEIMFRMMGLDIGDFLE